MPPSLPAPIEISPRGALTGRVRVPGDKSISHRALMFAALAVGTSRIEGLLEGHDVLATAAALRAMGATIDRDDDGTGSGTWRVDGVGVGGLLQPEIALDMGNSGTSTRLLMGLIASHPITATFVGDASLSARPMARAIEPLARMGAAITASPGGRLPLMVRGLCPAIPINYTLPVASAQVKSAVLIAGLNTRGITRVVEPVATRDHSERMLTGFGAALTVEQTNHGRIISITGEAELAPQAITVPGDPSSAAFWLVAGSIVPGSDIRIANVGLNPTRTGLIAALRLMGADITEIDPRTVGGEPVADLRVRHAPLTAIEVPPDLAPSMIDEYPVLFVAAAFAAGHTLARGAHELRVKESDRIAAMLTALTACGVPCEEFPDGLAITGTAGEAIPGGATIATLLDHRVAMSMAVAGLHAARPVTIDDASPVATSYPGFFASLDRLTGDET
ncbi:3-phosphoshikimate 1-carboxyvinyltransferase [Sphingomonas oligophenolica]|uniref:3-phosphoshikimate 1-carboxyvinyltransferase n=1 Tax=Sphingomonas oligophenolica TaxID=301154 RepID=A0A502C335_9SPHN|nr:3-phosphoshikimate 1-carboxyvinyltransferase [Sphingomonas oligophenolica]TPG07213.1 3-phosphoshikimate 1-carboxyvinyltransferase [Sphingomonas oligophenolica]